MVPRSPPAVRRPANGARRKADIAPPTGPAPSFPPGLAHHGGADLQEAQGKSGHTAPPRPQGAAAPSAAAPAAGGAGARRATAADEGGWRRMRRGAQRGTWRRDGAGASPWPRAEVRSGAGSRELRGFPFALQREGFAAGGCPGRAPGAACPGERGRFGLSAVPAAASSGAG